LAGAGYSKKAVTASRAVSAGNEGALRY